MNNDLISRSELKEAINTYDTFACLPDGKLYPVRELERPEMFKTYIYVEDVIKAIDNSLSVDISKEVWNKSNELLKKRMAYLNVERRIDTESGQECNACHESLLAVITFQLALIIGLLVFMVCKLCI